MSARRVLVTGGAGFIGSHLVDALVAEGDEVVVLDNESTGRREQVHEKAQFVAGDVRDPAAVARALGDGADAVLHVAGQASISLSFADPTVDLAVNTVGTINLLTACIARAVPRFLYASSMTVYGNPATVPTPEEEPVDPVSYYGITKYAAERYLHLTAARSDLQRAPAVSSLRMFNVYGPRQRLDNPYQGVLAIFLGRLLRGEEIVIHSDGAQSRDFVYVTDVVRAWLACLEEPQSHWRVYNLGSGRPTSVNQLCDVLLAQFGHDRSSYTVRPGPAQQGDIRSSAARIERARDELGWQPTISLDEGLAATVDWARRELGSS